MQRPPGPDAIQDATPMQLCCAWTLMQIVCRAASTQKHTTMRMFTTHLGSKLLVRHLCFAAYGHRSRHQRIRECDTNPFVPKSPSEFVNYILKKEITKEKKNQ